MPFFSKLNCVFQNSAGVLYLSGLGRGGRVLCQTNKNMRPKRTFAKNIYKLALKAKSPNASRGLKIGTQVCRSAMLFFEPPKTHQDNSLFCLTAPFSADCYFTFGCLVQASALQRRLLFHVWLPERYERPLSQERSPLSPEWSQQTNTLRKKSSSFFHTAELPSWTCWPLGCH